MATTTRPIEQDTAVVIYSHIAELLENNPKDFLNLTIYDKSGMDHIEYENLHYLLGFNSKTNRKARFATNEDIQNFLEMFTESELSEKYDIAIHIKSATDFPRGWVIKITEK